MTALRENPTWPARLLLLSSVLERSCGRTGLISTKELMATIAECRGPDDQFEIGHLGAVKGLNRFEDCAALIICGRLAVTPNTAERMAAVLLERDIAPLGDQRFPKAKQYLEGRKTNTGLGSPDRHSSRSRRQRSARVGHRGSFRAGARTWSQHTAKCVAPFNRIHPNKCPNPVPRRREFYFPRASRGHQLAHADAYVRCLAGGWRGGCCHRGSSSSLCAEGSEAGIPI